MAKFTFTEKSWKDVCPPSLSKDKTVGDAMGKLLKLVPGGSTDKIKSLADCVDALDGLEKLSSAVTKMAASVSKAKDDKNGAAASLTKWAGELKGADKDIKDRQADLCEEITKPVLTKWAKVFVTMEPHIKAVLGILKKIETQMGHSEQMRQEALFSLVKRAGDLSKTGHVGNELQDFMDDAEIKADYKSWEEQIDLYVVNIKNLEEQIDARKVFVTTSREMRKSIDDAVKELGSYAGSPSKAQETFDELNTGLAKLMKEVTGGKYITFDLIQQADYTASEMRTVAEKELRTRFKDIDSSAAEMYWAKGLAKRGLDERLLKKTQKDAGKKLDEVGTIVDAIAKKTIEAGDGVKRLQILSDELGEIAATHSRACKDMEVIQALSKDVNAKAKKIIEEAGAEFDLAAKLSADALKRAKVSAKGAIGSHRAA